jgi:hypothetical protein
MCLCGAEMALSANPRQAANCNVKAGRVCGQHVGDRYPCEIGSPSNRRCNVPLRHVSGFGKQMFWELKSGVSALSTQRSLAGAQREPDCDDFPSDKGPDDGSIVSLML